MIFIIKLIPTYTIKMEVENQETTNAFEGAPQQVAGQIFTGLGYIPESTPKKQPNKHARRQAKQEAFYLQHFEEWGTRFLQAYTQNFATDNLGYFYNPDSKLTFKHRVPVENGIQIQKNNISGAQGIYELLQVFRNLKTFHIDDYQIQPCQDMKGILITCEARLEPLEGHTTIANMTFILAKFPEPKFRRQIGEYSAVMYIYNQVISMY